MTMRIWGRALVLLMGVCAGVCAGCKAKPQGAQSDVMIVRTASAANVNRERVRVFSDMLLDAQNGRTREIPAAAAFGLFPLTDAERSVVDGMGYAPFAVECEAADCYMTTVPAKSDPVELRMTQVDVRGVGQPLIRLDGELRLRVRRHAAEVIEVCSVDGMSLFHVKWVRVNGALLDLRKNTLTLRAAEIFKRSACLESLPN